MKILKNLSDKNNSKMYVVNSYIPAGYIDITNLFDKAYSKISIWVSMSNGTTDMSISFNTVENGFKMFVSADRDSKGIKTWYSKVSCNNISDFIEYVERLENKGYTFINSSVYGENPYPVNED